MTSTVQAGPVRIGGKEPLVLIAGPCVIESKKACLELAKRLVHLAQAEKIPFIFKASYDKANRSSVAAFRGPGLPAGLEVLAEVREKMGVPVLTDVHNSHDVAAVAAYQEISRSINQTACVQLRVRDGLGVIEDLYIDDVPVRQFISAGQSGD